MKKSTLLCCSLVWATCFLPGPTQAQAPQLIFHTTLNGGEETPPVNTDGQGLITLLFNADRSKVLISGLLVQLQGDVTAAYLHQGKKGETGDTLLNLLPIITGRRVAGEIDVPPGLLSNLLVARVYANIRTTAHPNGEIRGQFIGETDLDFNGLLTGDGIVPPNNSAGIAFGGIHFPTGSDEIVYAFLVRGLSGPITGAEIREGQPGENGPLVGDMNSFSGNILNGLTELADLPADFLQKCQEGRYYAVVKTAPFPDGEVRGQINFRSHVVSFAPVNGFQQVPPPSFTPGFGFSFTTIRPTVDSLTTTVLINDLAPTSANIRIAAPGSSGPVFQALDEDPAMPGVYRKTYPVTPTQLTDFIEGRLYLNFGTAAYPDGEIRGQLRNTLRKGYAFDLCGTQVAPANGSTALGMAMFSVDQANCYINYKIMIDGLAGTPTEAYIRQGPPGENGVALYPIAVSEPLITGFHAMQASESILFEAGNVYIIIHSPAYPDGEIRGAVRRGFSCPLVSGVFTPNEISQLAAYPVPFQDVLQVQLESRSDFEGYVVLHDLLGNVAFRQAVEFAAGEQHLQLPTGPLPPGAYRLSLETAERSWNVKTVIKIAH